jgi:basic membrane protein A
VKKIAASALLLTAAALALSACGTPPPEGTPTTTGSAPTTATDTPTTQAPTNDFSACMISDAGGFEDRSFNQSGWEGMLAAQADLGIQINKAESKNSNDYTPNVSAMIAQNCDLIFTVGFNLKSATETAATANPDSHFAIIDNNEIVLPNVKSLVFKTSDAAFLGGYVAAAYSKTGTVATFGGMQIPTVTIFMDGFVDGVAKYNEDFGKTVKVLGWDKAAQTGVFTGDFDDQSKGQNTTVNFIDQGADVVMPVAGPVGNGAAAAAQAAGNVAIIWVDSDGFESATQYQDVFLTSVMKEIGAAVHDTIKATESGAFSNEPYIGTLANGGVGIAPFHNFEDQIPQEVKDKLEQLTADISSGALVVTSPSDPQTA